MRPGCNDEAVWEGLVALLGQPSEIFAASLLAADMLFAERIVVVAAVGLTHPTWTAASYAAMSVYHPFSVVLQVVNRIVLLLPHQSPRILGTASRIAET